MSSLDNDREDLIKNHQEQQANSQEKAKFYAKFMTAEEDQLM